MIVGQELNVRLISCANPNSATRKAIPDLVARDETQEEPHSWNRLKGDRTHLIERQINAIEISFHKLGRAIMGSVTVCSWMSVPGEIRQQPLF
jgi:hypothetical protein